MRYKLIILTITFSYFFHLDSYSQSLKMTQASIVVSDMEKSIDWYTKILGLELYKRLSFPEYDSLEIAFLKNDEFGVELLAKRNSFSIKEYVNNYSVNNAPQYGFYKIAFSTDNLDLFYSKVLENNCKIIIHLTSDQVFNVRYFIFSDLDGNSIQIIQ